MFIPISWIKVQLLYEYGKEIHVELMLSMINMLFMSLYRANKYSWNSKLFSSFVIIFQYYKMTWTNKTNAYTHICSSSIKTYIILPPLQFVPFQMCFSLHWHCSLTQTSFPIHWCVVSHDELIVSPSKTEFMKGKVNFERIRVAKVLWKCVDHYDLIGSVLSLLIDYL